LWPGELAVGKTLLAGPADRSVEVEVIGVVRDAYFTGRMSLVRDMLPRFIFFSSAERPGRPGEATYYIRHQGPQDAVVPTVAKALREVDSRVAIARVRSLDSHIAADVAPLRMLTTLLALFAGGSLLIAAIGQYAVVAFDGRRRSREFGVRIALGASSQQLIASVIAESFRSTAIGLAIGFALSVAVATILARLLYGITPTDPPTYFGVFILLAAASLLACYLPARRASRTDPVKALRTE
jgi:putative ABC transport system permease protein